MLFFPLWLLIFSLCFYLFTVWLIRVSACSSLGLSYMGNILDLSERFLSHVREVFAPFSLQIFYQAHYFLILWPLFRMFACLMLSQRSLKLSFFLYIIFPLFCTVPLSFTILLHLLCWFLLVYFSFQSLFICLFFISSSASLI